MKLSSVTHPTAPLGFKIWRASPGSMGFAHTHSDVEINFLFRGEIRYFFGGRFVRVPAGKLAVFWAGIPHQSLSKARETEGIWITFPLAWLLQWPLAGALRDRLMGGQIVLSGVEGEGVCGADRSGFELWLSDFETGSSAKHRLLAAELECRLSRLALDLPQLPEARAKPAGSGGVQKLEQTAAYLGARYQESLSVDAVAREVGLHPKYLLGLFRRHCNMTLWEYVTRLRLAHAQRLLLTTERTVLDVAMESGFGSAASFYHAFQRHLPGVRPTEFRASEGRDDSDG